MVSPSLSLLGQVQSGSSPSLIFKHETDSELHDNDIIKMNNSITLQSSREEDNTVVPLPSHLQPVLLTRREEICVLPRLSMKGGRQDDHLGVPASLTDSARWGCPSSNI